MSSDIRKSFQTCIIILLLVLTTQVFLVSTPIASHGEGRVREPDSPTIGSSDYPLQGIDVAVTSIDSHQDGSEYKNTSQTVEALVNNTGTSDVASSFEVNLTVRESGTGQLEYTDNYTVSALDVSETTIVSYDPWDPSDSGVYSINVTAELGSDENSTNDWKEIEISIVEEAGVIVEAPEPKRGDPGDVLDYNFNIINNGTGDDHFIWSAVSGHGWVGSGASGTTPVLSPGESFTTTVTIEIPSNISGHENDRLNLTATSNQNSSVLDWGVVITYTDEVHNVKVISPEPKNGEPGEELNYTFRVKNIGNVPDSYELSLEADNQWWDGGFVESNKTGTVAVGESVDVRITLEIPEVTPAYKIESKNIYYGATGDLTLRAEAENGFINSSTVKTEVDPIYKSHIEALEDRKRIDYSKSPQEVEFTLRVKNLCNFKEPTAGRDRIELDNKTPVHKAPWGETNVTTSWLVSISDENVTLDAGSSVKVQALVTAPREPLNGTCTVVIESFPQALPEEPGSIYPSTDTIEVDVNQTGKVRVKDGEPSEKEAPPLDWVYFNYTIVNTGNGLDSYSLNAYSEHDWTVRIVGNNKTGDIEPDEEWVTMVKAKVPMKTPIGFRDDIFLEAYSLFERHENARNVSTSGEAEIVTIQGYEIDLKPENNYTTVEPGQPAVYSITIANLGNGQDTVKLSTEYESLPHWTVELEDDTFTIDRWTNITTQITVTPGEDASHDEPFNVSITGTSQGNTSKSDTVNTTTNVTYVPDLEVTLSPSQIHAQPGDRLAFELKVFNHGNGEDTFSLEGNLSHGSWWWEIERENLTISAHRRETCTVNLTVPDLPEDPTESELQDLWIVASKENTFSIQVSSLTDPEVENDDETTVIIDKKTNYTLRSEKAAEEVLPGYTVERIITVDNWGNGPAQATLTLERTSERYITWGTLENTTLDLEIGEASQVTLSVSPPVADEPYWHEDIMIDVGVMGQSESILTRTRVVMLDCKEPDKELRLGSSLNYNLTVVNVPLEDDPKSSGESLIRTINLTERIVSDSDPDDWMIDFEDSTVEMSTAYQSEDTSLTVKALGRVKYSLELEITAKSLRGDEDMSDTIDTRTRLIWFDIYVESIGIDKDVEGERTTINVTFDYTGQNVSDIPFKVYVEGELIDPDDDGYSGVISSTGSGDLSYKLKYKLPLMDWNRKSKSYSIRAVVDPDNDITETNEDRDAEENNEYTVDKQINDFTPSMWVSLTVLIVSAVLLFVMARYVFDYHELYLPIGLLVAVLIGSMFVLPWQEVVESVTMMNILGNGVILAGIVLFGVISVFAGWRSRSFLHRKVDFNGEEEEEIEERSYEKQFNYYSLMISCIVGAMAFLMYPVMLIIVGVEEILNGSGIGALFLDDNFLGVPNILFPFIFLGITVALILAALWYQNKVWKKIMSVEEDIDRLKREAIRSMGMDQEESPNARAEQQGKKVY